MKKLLVTYQLLVILMTSHWPTDLRTMIDMIIVVVTKLADC